MEVEYSLTPEDFIAFNWYHAEYPVAGRGFSNTRFLVGMSALVTLFAVLALLGGMVTGGALLLGLMAAVWLLLLVRPWLVAQSARRLLRQGNNAHKLLTVRRLILSPEGLKWMSGSEAGLIPWGGVKRIAVTPNHAFFYQTAANAHIVPKRAFASEGDFRAFVEAAQEYRQAALAV